MFGPDPLKIPRRFVDCLNARDVDALSDVISDDCRIIDPRGAWVEGRDTCLQMMRALFKIDPDYRIHVNSMGRSGGNVLIAGRTTARNPRFATTTLWRARSDSRHLHEWQSYSSAPGVSYCRLLVGDKAQMGPFLEGAV